MLRAACKGGRGPVAIRALLRRALSTSPDDAKIGFIGLGQMGARMAANLVAKVRGLQC